MITAIQDMFHDLKKGQNIKIVCSEDYVTYINRTDIIKPLNRKVLMVYRANGAKVAINTKKAIMCCVIERL